MKALKTYKCDYYEVDVPEDHCLFCKHCTDVFYDWNGPYAFACALTTDSDGIAEAHFGYIPDCKNFIEAEGGE